MSTEDTKFDPFPSREWTPEQVSKYFGRHSDAVAAQKLFVSDQPAYERMRKLAVIDKLVQAKPEWADPNYRDKFEPKQYTEAELTLLAAVTVEECNKYYRTPSAGSHDTLDELSKQNPTRYKQIRDASILRGIVTPSTQPSPRPEPPKPLNTLITLSDTDADAAGLPRNYRTTEAGLKQIRAITQQVAVAKQEAAARAAKDAANDEEVSKYGHVRETFSPVLPAAQAVEVALAAFDRKALAKKLDDAANELAEHDLRKAS